MVTMQLVSLSISDARNCARRNFYTVNRELGVAVTPRARVSDHLLAAVVHLGVIENIEVIREDPSIVDVDTPEAIEPTEDGAVAPRNLLATVADIYWSGLGKSRWD